MKILEHGAQKIKKEHGAEENYEKEHEAREKFPKQNGKLKRSREQRKVKKEQGK